MPPGARPAPSRSENAFPQLALVYFALYGAFGAESPFLPSFLDEHGLTAAEIGTVLAAGTLVRIGSGPAIGFVADRSGRPARVLAVAAAMAAVVSLLYLPARFLGPLAAVAALHAVAIAGLAPVSDAVALGFARRDGFSYGSIRAVGSAAFVAGTLAAGQLVPTAGLSAAIVLSAGLFGVMAGALLVLPDPPPATSSTATFGRADALAALGSRRFLLLALTAGLVIGSHALNDAFGVIVWRKAGLGDRAVSLLWSTAVLSEVAVFLLIGPALLARLGPGLSLVLGALAGALRWGVLASTAAVPALIGAQLGHGLTFGLVHLAAMRVIAATVPPAAAATAQTVYGTFGLGLASATLTWASGELYGRFGSGAYLAMAGLCLLAVPLGLRVGNTDRDPRPVGSDPRGPTAER